MFSFASVGYGPNLAVAVVAFIYRWLVCPLILNAQKLGWLEQLDISEVGQTARELGAAEETAGITRRVAAIIAAKMGCAFNPNRCAASATQRFGPDGLGEGVGVLCSAQSAAAAV
jgi:hypothetical protein